MGSKMHLLNIEVLMLLAILFICTKCEQHCFISFNSCAGKVNCDGSLDFNTDFRNWECLIESGYNDYGYRRYIKVNYDKNYELTLLYNHLNTELLSSHSMVPPNLRKDRIVYLKLTNSAIVSVPDEVYSFEKIRNIDISNNEIEKLDLSFFVNKYQLININASNNKILVLESENNTDVKTGINSVNSIDLSFNWIKHIPNNYFLKFINLLHLNISNNLIEHLDILTFEGLTNLQTLHLSYNKLKDIGHTMLRFQKMRELTLDNNQITALAEPNFKSMHNLQKLNLSSNLIEVIEDTTFENLNELLVLDVRNNIINRLPKILFKNNLKIVTLDLSENKISSIEQLFSGMTIKQFRIHNNHLTGAIDRTTLSSIAESKLDLSNNRLTSVNSNAFEPFGSEIIEINLKNNSLSNISKTAFHSLVSLNTLDLSINNISETNFDLSQLKELTYLNMSNNKLNKISKILLQNLTSLLKLDLSHNCINHIEDGTFDSLNNLVKLNLKYNSLANTLRNNIFYGLTTLTHMYLTNTRIVSYLNHTFIGMRNLKLLEASYGELMTIEYEAFNDTGSLEIIDLSHNLLESFLVNVNTISGVEKLLLQNNRINNVTHNMFLGLNKLIELNLASNNIIEIETNSFGSLPKLSKLNVSYNEEMKFDGSEINNLSLVSLSLNNIKRSVNFKKVFNTTAVFLDLSSCNIEIIQSVFVYKITERDLNLSSNKITYIGRDSFQKMDNLRKLDLSFNLIYSIQPGSFRYTNLIYELNLYANAISSLEYGVFDGLQNLHTLNISRNSLHSFDVNLLHNSPQVSIISLDDNLIENLNFHAFVVKNLHEISVGGNLISCDEFVYMKTVGMGSLKITAENLDYHTENVDGIRCRTNSNNNLVNTLSQINTLLPNITKAFNSLTQAMEIFRDTIESAVRQTSNEDNSTKKRIEEVLISINKLVKVNNESQSMTNIYLKKLLDKDTSSLRAVSDNIKNEDGRHDNTPIYVTLGCLVLLLGLFMFLVHSYYKSRYNNLQADNVSSSRLANSIEME